MRKQTKLQKFLKILKPLGFYKYSSDNLIAHNSLNVLIDITDMDDTSTIIKKVVDYGILVGQNEKVTEIKNVLTRVNISYRIE